jgi:hypothetical protein
MRSNTQAEELISTQRQNTRVDTCRVTEQHSSWSLDGEETGCPAPNRFSLGSVTASEC